MATDDDAGRSPDARRRARSSATGSTSAASGSSPPGGGTLEVIDSTTEEVMGTRPRGHGRRTSTAPSRAARGPRSRRGRRCRRTSARELRGAIGQGLAARGEEIAALVAREVGMPIELSTMIQAGLPTMDVRVDARAWPSRSQWEEQVGNSLIVREPVGVVGCITPWNYPLHQIGAKVAPALAAGCTVVLKPSEVTPLNAFVLAEIIDEVGLPAGVFNLVAGTGPVVGEAIAAHPGVDMISFTGSTRAGGGSARWRRGTVKRVALELGGKSPNVILDDADLMTRRRRRASASASSTRARPAAR